MRDVDEEQKQMISKIVKWGVLVVVLIIGLFIVLDGFYIVNPGERAIVLTLGKPSEMPQAEGFHIKIPIIQSVVLLDVKTQKYEASASAASSDLQTVSTNIAVNYHLNPDGVVMLYKEIGISYGDKIIQPAVQEVVKSSTAQFTAENLITKRADVKQSIDMALAERLNSRGIILETTSITNFDFSAQFNQAIEQKVTAEQNALTEKNRLAQIQFQAQQAKAEAEGKRDAVIAKAEGDAKSTLLNAQAEAERVKLIQEQLSQSPQYVEYIKAQRWDGKLPTTMFGSAIPLIQFPVTPNEQASTK